VPRVVSPVDKLPRLGSGKFDYVALKAMAQEREPAADTPQP
jgi:acyl-coenzyme A synthetase/AMP-(fatty) acid ligase